MRSTQWKRTLVVAPWLLLITGVAMATLAPDPVALLVKYEGDVQVQRPGADAPLGGEVGLQLLAGDRLLVPEGGRAVFLYRTGRLVNASAAVTIEEMEETEASSLFTSTVRTLGEVATTDARTQPNRQGMIRPIAGAPAPVAPRNEVRVLGVRPTFTWYAVPEARGYMLQLQRKGPDSPSPVRYQVGTDTTWTLPASETPLVPGATYTWTVGGDGVGRVAAPQQFTVIGGEELAELQSHLNGLIEAGIDPAADGLFLTALAYRDAGLFYEARRALRQLEEQGDGSGSTFFMLKGEVLDALGELEGAEAAFRTAESPMGR